MQKNFSLVRLTQLTVSVSILWGSMVLAQVPAGLDMNSAAALQGARTGTQDMNFQGAGAPLAQGGPLQQGAPNQAAPAIRSTGPNPMAPVGSAFGTANPQDPRAQQFNGQEQRLPDIKPLVPNEFQKFVAESSGQGLELFGAEFFSNSQAAGNP
jgi:hypothetical protein